MPTIGPLRPPPRRQGAYRPRRDLGHAATCSHAARLSAPDEDPPPSTPLRAPPPISFNASTFTAKIVTSTISDYYSAIVAALGALKGVSHGGANQKAMEMMLEIGDVDNVDAFIDNALATKRRLMGMGHRIYKTYDPRAAQLNEHAHVVAERSGNTKWYGIATRIDNISRHHEYFNERKIYPIFEFYAATLLYTLGFKPDMMPALFGCSRISAGPLNNGSDSRQPHHPPQTRIHRTRNREYSGRMEEIKGGGGKRTRTRNA